MLLDLFQGKNTKGQHRFGTTDSDTLHLVVDLRDGGVVLLVRVRVHALGVEVADAVVGLDDAAELAVAGVVEAGVRGEDEELAGLLPPADLLLAHDGLHDGVEAALGGVEVTGHLGALDLALFSGN